MNKKSFLTLAGVITTIIAMSSSAFACHFHKNEKQTNKNSEIIEENTSKDNSNSQQNCVKVIEVQEDKTKLPEDLGPVLKYATPYIIKEICDPVDSIDKNIPLSMYALPNFEYDENVENASELPKFENPWK